MIVLDASVLIAHPRPQDAHHDAATSYLDDHAEEGFIIQPLNLAEVLVGGVRAGRGEELLADLRAIGLEVADRVEEESLHLATLRVRTGLKLPRLLRPADGDDDALDSGHVRPAPRRGCAAAAPRRRPVSRVSRRRLRAAPPGPARAAR